MVMIGGSIGAVILLVLTMISEKKHHAEIAAKRG
jgi:OPA family glycerol-3-phosphate transporter-like MFS transporter